eukprot:TRINITY_DN3769_c0_g1_i5.p5 TRINITY_DN3769_c0_g1~~TRINITY_DN3769_c0_g1_i5.p5  ORF type:complete len:125 (-),score=1.80 TRINITY_DN3769_c0_g1_i5:62-436(-)
MLQVLMFRNFAIVFTKQQIGIFVCCCEQQLFRLVKRKNNPYNLTHQECLKFQEKSVDNLVIIHYQEQRFEKANTPKSAKMNGTQMISNLCYTLIRLYDKKAFTNINIKTTVQAYDSKPIISNGS